MEQFASFHRSAQESCESLSPAQYAEVCAEVEKVHKQNEVLYLGSSSLAAVIQSPQDVMALPFSVHVKMISWSRGLWFLHGTGLNHSSCCTDAVLDVSYPVGSTWLLKETWEEVTTWTLPLFLLFLTLQCSQNSYLRGSPWTRSPRQLLWLLALEISCLTAALSLLVQNWISFTDWPADSSLLSFIELSRNTLYFCALYR